MAQKAGTRSMGDPRVQWGRVMAMLVPLALTTLVQQAYLLIAIPIAAYLGGAKVLGAVQAVSFPVECAIVLGVSLCAGFAVSIGNAYGEGDDGRVGAYAGTSLWLSVGAGALVGIVSWMLAPAIASAMSVPTDVSGDAVTYLRCMSVVILLAYPANSLLATLRSTGSQSTVLLVVMLSGAWNAALDAVMLSPGISTGVLDLGVAQVVTYALMLVLSLWRLAGSSFHLNGGAMVSARCLLTSFDGVAARQMLGTGLPMAAMAAGFQASTCLVQADVNSYGLTASSAYGIANRINSISWSLASSMGMTMTVLTSQILGEEKEDRTRALDVIEGVRKALWSINTNVLLPVVMFLILSSYPFGLLLSGSEDMARQVQGMFAVIGCLMCVYAQGEVLMGILKGAGDGRTPLLISIIGIVVTRLSWVFLISPHVRSAWFACLAMPVSWVILLILAMMAYRNFVRKFLGRDVIFRISSSFMQKR